MPSASKREPWHGQSQVFELLLKLSSQPKCGQFGLHVLISPFIFLYAARFLPFIITISPLSGFISLCDLKTGRIGLIIKLKIAVPKLVKKADGAKIFLCGLNNALYLLLVSVIISAISFALIILFAMPHLLKPVIKYISLLRFVKLPTIGNPSKVITSFAHQKFDISLSLKYCPDTLLN